MEGINMKLPLLAVLVLFLGFLLRIWGVAQQPPLLDEVNSAFAAINYMENGQFGPTMWYHPNLRNIVQYGAMEVFGHGPFALRGMSLFAGIVSIPLTGMILYGLTGNRGASLLAAFLLAVEQVHITFSRQTIQETWTTFFFLLGVLSFIYYVKREKPWLLLLCGVIFGLGMASKFHALFPLLVCLAAGVQLAWKERSAARGTFIAACLILVPLTVYLLTYIPWFGRGYGLMDWVNMQQTLLMKMTTHRGNPMDQTIDIAAWQWFLRPLGYANFVFHEGRPFVTIAYSNPLVWLLVLPATVFQSWLLIRKKVAGEEARGVLFILVLFVLSYLPLAVSTRPIWLLSSLATIPFAFMVVALSITNWVKNVNWGKRALAGYIAVVLVSSAALYPLATGKGKHYDYLSPIVERFRPAFEGGRSDEVNR